jgi:CRP/FNR family transcriptional regulator, cyclic AMP receptor protein
MFVDALRRVALLHCFDDEEIVELSTCAKTLDHEVYSNIIIEGELSWGIYFVVDGVCEVLRDDPLHGATYQVAQLVAGSFFGELSLIDSNPRSATVRAMTETRTLYIEKIDFDKFIAKNVERKLRFYEHALMMLASRLRDVDENFMVAQYQLWSNALDTKGKAA